MRRASRAEMSWPHRARSSACVTVAVRSGRSPRRRDVGAPDERIGAEPPQELGVVVAAGEHEAKRVEGGFGRRTVETNLQLPARGLPHAREGGLAAGFEGAREQAVAEVPRAVGGAPRRLGEGVRAPGPERRLDRHRRSLAPPPDRTPAPVVPWAIRWRGREP